MNELRCFKNSKGSKMLKRAYLYQFLASSSALLIIVTSGMHYAWPSPSLPRLLSNSSSLEMTSGQGAYIAIIQLIGGIVGSMVAAVVVDIVGRKVAILFTAIPFFAAWIMVAFANSVFLLFAARFMAGVVDGIAFTAIPVYIGEIADPRIRGLLGSNISAAWIFGMLLINIIGSYLDITLTALVSSVVPVLFFVTFLWMPESPYMLIMKERFDAARDALRKFKGREDVEEELERLKRAIKIQSDQNRGKFMDLFTRPSNRKAIVVMMILRNALQFCGVSAITFYTQLIFREAGDFVPPEVATIIYYTLQFVMTFACSAIIDKTGRRPLLIISLVGSSVALFCQGSYFYIQSFTSVDTSSFTFVPLIALMGYVIILNLGMQPIPLLILSEVFPTNVKAFACSLSEIYFCILASIVSKCFQLISDTYGMYLPFYIFSVSCVINLVFIVLFVPETKGKTLEAIQDGFEGGWRFKR